MKWYERVAFVTSLASSAKRSFGRTALMKFMYFLQELRNVPLGYNFTLYSYGPFDSDVLSDLSSAEGCGAVTSTLSIYAGGYGYEIRPGDGAKRILRENKKLLSSFEKDIKWVVDNFGDLSSSQLELVGTVIFVARELGGKADTDSVAGIVRELKPHFEESAIKVRIEELRRARILT